MTPLWTLQTLRAIEEDHALLEGPTPNGSVTPLLRITDQWCKRRKRRYSKLVYLTCVQCTCNLRCLNGLQLMQFLKRFPFILVLSCRVFSFKYPLGCARPAATSVWIRRSALWLICTYSYHVVQHAGEAYRLLATTTLVSFYYDWLWMCEVSYMPWEASYRP